MVMNEEKVSVIVPIYKVEKYIDACVKSIMAQTYENLEILLVDDGSPDSCPEMCEELGKLDNRIVVIHKKNGGLSDARNAGIEAASGSYYTFVDGDDTIEPNAIEEMMKAAKSQNAKIVMMKMRNVYEGEPLERAALPSQGSAELIKNEDYLIGICTYKRSCSFCDKLFAKEVLKGYRFSVGKTNEDLLLLGTILIENDYDIYAIDYAGYNYLQRNQSITKSGFGKSVKDTIYNCHELEELAREKKNSVYVYFRILSLYQARTFLIFMPKRYVKEKNEDYLFAMNKIKQNKKLIGKGFFSFKDKLFLRLSLISMRMAKMLVGEK